MFDRHLVIVTDLQRDFVTVRQVRFSDFSAIVRLLVYHKWRVLDVVGVIVRLGYRYTVILLRTARRSGVPARATVAVFHRRYRVGFFLREIERLFDARVIDDARQRHQSRYLRFPTIPRAGILEPDLREEN